MSIENAIAGIAVSDCARSAAWYAELLGRTADSSPMPTLLEWCFNRGGWLQVFEDTERAGKSSVTLSVTGFEAEVSRLQCLGIAVDTSLSSNVAKLGIMFDPDGNQIVIAEALTEDIAR